MVYRAPGAAGRYRLHDLAGAAVAKGVADAFKVYVAFGSSYPILRSFLKILIRSLLSFTATVSLLLASLRYGFRVAFIHNAIWYIVAFIFVLTALSLWLGYRGGRQSSESLVNYVLGGTVLRLVLSAIAVYIALRLGVADRLWFVLNFMAVYLLFLAFEIHALLNIKKVNT